MRSERLRRILLVARHEFLQTVGNKAFLFTLVLVPFMIVASALVPRWIKDRAISPPSVAIVDLTGRYESAGQSANWRHSAPGCGPIWPTYS